MGIMGSILAGAAAAGQSGVESINQNIAQQNSLDRAQQQSDLQFQNESKLVSLRTQAQKDYAQFQDDLRNQASDDAGDYYQQAFKNKRPIAAAATAPIAAPSEVTNSSDKIPSTTPVSASDLMDAIKQVESNNNPNAVGPVTKSGEHALGSVQIMPGTFNQYAKPGDSLYNDDDRVAAATRKVQDDLKYYMGDPAKVAAAYLGGRGAVLPDGSIRDDVTDGTATRKGNSPLAYSKKVMAILAQKQAAAAASIPSKAAVPVATPVATSAPSAAPSANDDDEEDTLANPDSTDNEKGSDSTDTQAATPTAQSTPSAAVPVPAPQMRDPTRTEALQDAIDLALKDGHQQAAMVLMNQAAQEKAFNDHKLVNTYEGLYDQTTGKYLGSDLSKSANDLKIAQAKNELAQMKINAAGAKNMNPDEIQKTAQAIADLRLAPPSPWARTKGSWPQVMDAVNNLDPSYDDTAYAAKKKTMLAFAGGGQEGRSLKSFNVFLDHADIMQKVIDALQNGNVQLANQIKNTVGGWMGNVNVTDLNSVKQLLAGEIVKSTTGAAGALGDRQGIENTFASKNSYDQLNSSLSHYKDLALSNVVGLHDQYVGNTRLNDFEQKYLNPRSRALVAPLLHPDQDPTQQPAQQTAGSTNQPSNLPTGVSFIGLR